MPLHLRSNHGDPDLLDQAFEFRVAYGRWPATWIEFCHGIGHLSRAAAAEKLRMADAHAASQQSGGDWRRWTNDQRTLAGG